MPSGGWRAAGAVALSASAWFTRSSSWTWFRVNSASRAWETGLACTHHAFSSGVLPGGMTGPLGSGIVVLGAPGRAVVTVVDDNNGPAASVVLEEASVVEVPAACVVGTAVPTVVAGR